MCDALIKARDCETFDVSMEVGEEKVEALQQRKLVHDTLSVLLACSHSAKQVALNGNLIDKLLCLVGVTASQNTDNISLY